MNKSKVLLHTISYIFMSVILFGCSSSPSNEADKEQITEHLELESVVSYNPEVSFPKVDLANIHQGIFPNAENVANISYGMTKQDIRHLFGVPHFREFMGTKKWNYVFKFTDKKTKKIDVCQFQVVFNKNNHAKAFYHSPESCSKNFREKFSLDADSLFDFNSAVLGPEGKYKLTKLVKIFKQQEQGQKKIYVDAYADKIGSDSANLAVSRSRAYSVKAFMVNLGVKPDQIIATGRGKSHLAECHLETGEELKRCLQLDRRVDITIK